jgi:5-methylcytosine-specific restriction enzyme A
MTDELRSYAIDSVGKRIGISVQGELKRENGHCLELTPVGIHPHDSFIVSFIPRWRIVEALFVPGKFAGPLIAQMGGAGAESRSAFIAFASALDKRRARLTFRVNGLDVSPMDPSTWPSWWNRLELVARSAPLVVDQANLVQMKQLILDLVIPLFGMLAALIGVEEAEGVQLGAPEGRPVQTLVTRYERKKVNREACIQLKGSQCVVCGFNFEAVYGDFGVGYIEVHHTIPVSQVGTDYHINVMTDLEPLCANCHAMVHREDPPIPIARLRDKIGLTPRG